MDSLKLTVSCHFYLDSGGYGFAAVLSTAPTVHGICVTRGAPETVS